jgi:hypothetical protein
LVSENKITSAGIGPFYTAVTSFVIATWASICASDAVVRNDVRSWQQVDSFADQYEFKVV